MDTGRIVCRLYHILQLNPKKIAQAAWFPRIS
jgi:hypothetical protein